MSYNNLYQNCNIAYDWSPDPTVPNPIYPYRTSTDPNATKIVKVSELLDAFPNDRISIEIKQVTPTAATALCTLITSKNATGRVLVSSGENTIAQPNMTAFRTACPTVATSATGYEAVEFIGFFGGNNFPADYNTTRLFSSLQVPKEALTDPVAAKAFVAKAHQYGMKVYPWTINTTAESQPLIDAGVDGINTSFPALVLTWMASPPLKYCADGGKTYKLTNPVTQHGCAWIMQGWLNEARDKYNQENNPAWVVLQGNSQYDTPTKNMVTLWQYISNGQLPVTGEANPATINSMYTACVVAQTTYAYNSTLC